MQFGIELSTYTIEVVYYISPCRPVKQANTIHHEQLLSLNFTQLDTTELIHHLQKLRAPLGMH